MTGEDAPQYLQIADSLAAEIVAGRLKAGQKIASERAIAEDMGVSRMTARHTIRVLTERGLVEARAGQGTFVGARVIEQKLNSLTGFTEQMALLGRKSSSIIVTCDRRAADVECQRAMKLAPGEQVYRLERIRLADNAPVARETTEVLVSSAPGLLDLADFGRESLYRTLTEHFGVRPTTASQTLAAGIADETNARVLSLAPGDPVLKLTRLTFDDRGAPFEYVRSVYRGDAFVMKVNLTVSEENAP